MTAEECNGHSGYVSVEDPMSYALLAQRQQIYPPNDAASKKEHALWIQRNEQKKFIMQCVGCFFLNVSHYYNCLAFKRVQTEKEKKEINLRNYC